MYESYRFFFAGRRSYAEFTLLYGNFLCTLCAGARAGGHAVQKHLNPRFTRSERCNLVKYLYPVIYWRLFKFRVGVNVGDRSHNMHELLELLVIVTNNLIMLTTFGSAAHKVNLKFTANSQTSWEFSSLIF